MFHIDSCHATVIRKQAVDLTLNIGRLGPDAPTACVQADLILELVQEKMAAIIPCLNGSINFVGLIDSVDGCLVVPEMLDGYVGPNSTKFTLEPNPGGIIWARGSGIEGSATLWVCIVVVVLIYVN